MLPNGTTSQYGLWQLTPSDQAEPYVFSSSAVDNAGPANDSALRTGMAQFYNARVIFVDATHAQISWLTLRIAGAPPAPTGLRAFGRDGSIFITWNSTNLPTIQGYEYEVTNNDTGRTIPWEVMPGSDFNTSSYTIDGLHNGTSYTIGIRAFNQVGTSQPSNPASATPVGDQDLGGGWKTIWAGILDEFDYKDAKSRRDLVEVTALGSLIYLAQNNDVSTSLQEDRNGAENMWLLCQSAFVPNDLIGNLTANHDLKYWWADVSNGLVVATALEQTEGGRLYENRLGRITLDGSNAVHYLSLIHI